MHESTHRSKAVRSRATRHLRHLTIGTTLAGMAASAGFGLLAAATYDGTASAADAADSTTITSDVTVVSPTATPAAINPTVSPSTTASSSSSATTTTTSSSTAKSSSRVTRSSGRAQVSTGAS